MKVVLIGSGNVAATLGRRFVKAGHPILQVLSRNAKAASELAYEWNTESANYNSLINREGDIYIVAVSDSAIEDVARDLRLPDKVVAHTAASVKMEVLSPVTQHYGVFYPLQSLRKESDAGMTIPIYTEGATEKSNAVLQELAASISGKEVYQAGFDKRVKLHVAGVILNNFINYIFSLAEDYCKKEGIAFSELLPLVNHTIERLEKESPSGMQTGPAFRHDYATVDKHIELLQSHPDLQKLYVFISKQIMGE
jgi:predicted short-subunit dehydrogenase-like oxidoreductase (DUF2520 family)